MHKITFLIIILQFYSSCKARVSDNQLYATGSKNLRELKKIDTDDILKFINQKPGSPRTLDALIDKLPDYLFQPSNYVLMRTSKSMCENEISAPTDKTNAYPRVIQFDSQTNLVVAYTGNPEGRCYNTLEIFQHGNSNLSLVGMVADQGKRDTVNVFLKVVFNKESRPEVIAGAEAGCGDCHHSENAESSKVRLNGRKPGLLPIWSVGRNSWPNAYGAVDAQLSKTEINELRMFSQTTKQSPRYRRLVGNYADLPKSPSNTAIFKGLSGAELGPEDYVTRVPFENGLNELDGIFKQTGHIDP